MPNILENQKRIKVTLSNVMSEDPCTDLMHDEWIKIFAEKRIHNRNASLYMYTKVKTHHNECKAYKIALLPKSRYYNM